jgi:hypothetical protein
MKFNVHKRLQERVRSFYVDALQYTPMPSPASAPLFSLMSDFTEAELAEIDGDPTLEDLREACEVPKMKRPDTSGDWLAADICR